MPLPGCPTSTTRPIWATHCIDRHLRQSSAQELSKSHQGPNSSCYSLHLLQLDLNLKYNCRPRPVMEEACLRAEIEWKMLSMGVFCRQSAVCVFCQATAQAVRRQILNMGGSCKAAQRRMLLPNLSMRVVYQAAAGQAVGRQMLLPPTFSNSWCLTGPSCPSPG